MDRRNSPSRRAALPSVRSYCRDCTYALVAETIASAPRLLCVSHVRSGVSFRSELAPWLATRPSEVRCLELSVDAALNALHGFRIRQMRRWPTALHASQLAVGAAAGESLPDLERVLSAVRAVDPMWICAYLGSRYRPETELSYPQPASVDRGSLGRAIANCRRLIEAGVRPLLVENVAAFGITADRLSPAEFINRLCDESGCGLLLDVTTLTIDTRLGFDPRRWLWEVDPSHVAAIRLRTIPRLAEGDGVPTGDSLVTDSDWALAREIAKRTSVASVVLQLRGQCPTIDELQAELRLTAAVDRFAAPLEALPTAAGALI